MLGAGRFILSFIYSLFETGNLQQIKGNTKTGIMKPWKTGSQNATECPTETA
jgi:hypothetical protein